MLYSGEDIHCAFIETFGHDTGTRVVSLEELRRRGVTRIDHTQLLRLVDLTGPGLAQLGADNRLCSGAYDIAQQWSLALYDHPELPDGIYYRACHDPSRFAAAIFDRAEGLLTTQSLETLATSQNAALLGNILDLYKFGLV